jgi:L-seryl-tRNA(Ser) seleniumtransferase
MPTLAQLAAIAHNQPGVLLIDDLGSGTLLDTAIYGLAAEPMVQESVAAGADLVTFSGDKLLGGPQAGVIVGRKELIARLRRHPMARALRVDKLTLAALDATLRSYQREQAINEVPVWQMIGATVEQLRERATQWQAYLATRGVAATVLSGESAVGGGSLPGETLPTTLLALDHPRPDQLAARLRQAPTPIVGRIQHDQLVLDPRTVLPVQDHTLLQQLVGALSEQ